MNPNLCDSKPYPARFAQKARPKYNLYILKKVFMLLLKCELASSTPVFSQEIFIGFNETAHANSEDATAQIIHTDTYFIFLERGGWVFGSRAAHPLLCPPTPTVFRALVHPEQTWVKLLCSWHHVRAQILQWAWNLPKGVFQRGSTIDLWALKLHHGLGQWETHAEKHWL